MSASSSAPHTRNSRRIFRRLGAIALIVLVGLAGAATWLYVQLHGSLAQLDGEAMMPGASSTIVIARDALGIPTINAGSRADVARGLGFVHAQDRFFQMDLARRRAAGELAELFGSAAAAIDTRTRKLRLRAHVHRAIQSAAPEEFALLSAYADGVNAGLNALTVKPPEYLLLRIDPRPWTVEDSGLVLASMFLTLQDSEARRESRLAAAYAALPGSLAEFMTATSSNWETPLLGSVHGGPPVPDASVFDLRIAPPLPPRTNTRSEARDGDALLAWLGAPGDQNARGSNNWAVSGRLTADGGAIIADDMHLGLSVPNIWYRASMQWQDGRLHWLMGVTLPGLPSLVAGSNGDVAWGFTNTSGDWSDLVVIERDPLDANRYRTPSGMMSVEISRETIKVKSAPSISLDVRETIWGPIVDRDRDGSERAVAWVPLRDGGLNQTWTRAETAETIEDLFEIAAHSGIPAQNMVAVQRDGRIGWTIAGRIPHRIGFDGRLPTSWADGARRWEGWVVPAEYPRVIDPPGGVIVTANNRLVDGEFLRFIGDGGYDPGARARQIRDDLVKIVRPSTRDMLSVQLDDRALFLTPWRDLLVKTLGASDREHSEAQRELLRVVGTTWTGRASPDSAAYRIVRDFRAHVNELAFAPLVERIRQLDPDYSLAAARSSEGPLWALVTEQPAHLLDPKFKSWTDLFLAAADLVAEEAQKAGGIASYTWGGANTVRIRHPFSSAMPVLGLFLDMSPEELPGDSNMPRVQGASFGASERFAVSPGREKDGYLHMPTGESGHLLSPHYRDSNRAWVAGSPTSFLPGPTLHTLNLRPPAPGRN